MPLSTLASALDRARSAGLNLTSLRFLLCVKDGMAVQSDIHRLLGLSCAAVGQTADNLEISGFITRLKPQSLADKRKVPIALTDAGSQLLTSLLEP